MATRRPVNRITPRKRPAGTPEDAAAESATTDATVKSTAAKGNTAASAADAPVKTAEPASPADPTVRAAVDAPTDPTVQLSTPNAATASDADPTVRLSTEPEVAEPQAAGPEVAGPGSNLESGKVFGGEIPVNAQFQSSSGRKSRIASGSARTLIVLAAAAAVLTAFAVLAAFRPGVPGGGNRAFADPAATTEVTAAARNALQTVYSYDSKTVGGYKDAVHAVVTGKMRTDFDSFADTTVSAIQQAQSSATATADPIGVTMLTGDHAELLVNLVVSASKDGVPQETASGPIVLRMEKIKGHWLASEIADR